MSTHDVDVRVTYRDPDTFPWREKWLHADVTVAVPVASPQVAGRVEVSHPDGVTADHYLYLADGTWARWREDLSAGTDLPWYAHLTIDETVDPEHLADQASRLLSQRHPSGFWFAGHHWDRSAPPTLTVTHPAGWGVEVPAWDERLVTDLVRELDADAPQVQVTVTGTLPPAPWADGLVRAVRARKNLNMFIASRRYAYTWGQDAADVETLRDLAQDVIDHPLPKETL